LLAGRLFEINENHSERVGEWDVAGGANEKEKRRRFLVLESLGNCE